MKTKIYIIVCCLIALTGRAQNTRPDPGCGTTSAMQAWYRKNPASRIEAQRLNEFTKSFKSISSGRTQAATYVIPVVFHVFGSDFAGATVTDAKIITALQKVNEDFRGFNDDFGTVDPNFQSLRGTLNIEFKLAKIDPQGNATTGIRYYPAKNGFGNGGGFDDEIRQYAWDNYKYMNVYIQLDLYADGDHYNSGVAWYPDTYMSDNNLARVVYNGRYLYGNTDKEFASVLSHEFGHYLNLIHTFEGGCTYPNDEVTDTPPTTTGAGCSNVLNCEGREINGENYMDYNVTCYKMFTTGQISRMDAALQHASRNPLWQASNLVATGVSGSMGPAVIVSNNNMYEGKANNGSIETVSNLTLSGTSWSASSGTMTQGTHYTVANVPSGLSVRITRLSSTTAKVELIGNAAAHTTVNSISNLQITFLNAALASNNANELYNKTLTYKVTFINPYRIIYSATFGSDNDLVITSADPWRWFTFNAGDANFGGWYDNGKLRLETYTKAAVCQGTTRNIVPLTLGTNIGPLSNWVAGGAYPDEHDIRSAAYTTWDGRTAYIGVRFNLGGNFVHGWIKAAVSSNGSTLTLYEYAYNETPDGVIRAGQTSLDTDTQAPSAPTNLVASNVTQTAAQLNWSSSTDNVGVTGYDIFRGTTDIGDATSTSFNVTGLAPATTYSFTVRAKDAAGNVSAASNVVTITTQGSINYCAVTNGSPGQYITRVVFGSINNSSTYHTGMYSNYTSLSTSVARGSTINLAVTLHAYWSGSKAAAWIDWNRDGDFTDTGERIMNASGVVSGSYTTPVTIPSTALLGTTRMRVRAEYGTSVVNPCGDGWHSEVEDYAVNVTGSAALIVHTNDEVPADKMASVYPNPNKGTFTVEVADTHKEIGIRVYNNVGTLVAMIRKTHTQQNEIKLDVPPGLYTVHITTPVGRIVKLIAVE
jgi:trimeric autotransporter adhesin